MNSLSILPPNTVYLANKTALTTSLAVAETFGKRHDNVLQAIQNMECSSEFSALNFKGAEYPDAQGKSRPMYEISKDGFVFLVMGFTGSRAAF